MRHQVQRSAWAESKVCPVVVETRCHLERVGDSERGREREARARGGGRRERERGRGRHRDRDRDRETERQRQRDSETVRQRDRDRETETKTTRERDRETERGGRERDLYEMPKRWVRALNRRGVVLSACRGAHGQRRLY